VPAVAENPIPKCQVWKDRAKRCGHEPAGGPWLGRGHPPEWNLGRAGYGPMWGELDRDAAIARGGLLKTRNRGWCG